MKLEKVKEPFPKFDVPDEHSTDTYFEYVARQGFEKRRPRLEALRAARASEARPAEYAERLDREIQHDPEDEVLRLLPDRVGFHPLRESSGTFRSGPGRGSAAGSLVSYAMEITDIDPLQYGLLFERFLNPERISMPDIDIDFCMNARRGEVIQYVTEKYGREQVAQIITFRTLGARAAIKDVGRVLDMTLRRRGQLTKLVPNVAQYQAQRRHRKPSRASGSCQKDPRMAEVLDVALRLEGMARNAGCTPPAW